MRNWRSWIGAIVVGALVGAGPSVGAQTMPSLSEMSGVPLPVADVPAGSVSVRVIRSGFENVAGAEVEFLIDGEGRVVVTDGEGRAQVDGLAAGTRLQARTVVDDQVLQSQEVVIGSSGFRIMLAVPEAAVRGLVVLGQESRVVAEMQDDALFVFYLLDIYNAGRQPVDIDGPLVFDLPREARGAAVMEGSSPNATASGPRIIVPGPFAPGVTFVQAVYEMPYSTGTVQIEQTWPAVLQQTTVLVQQIGGLTLRSAQFDGVREITDRGQPLLLGTGGSIPAGQSLAFEIAGLPYHPRWPRNVALTLAGLLVALGLWAAFAPAAPRR